MPSAWRITSSSKAFMSPSLARRTRAASSSGPGRSAALVIAPRQTLPHAREHRHGDGLRRGSGKLRERRDHLLEARQQLAALRAVTRVALDPLAAGSGELGIDVLGHMSLRPAVVARETDPCQRAAHGPRPYASALNRSPRLRVSLREKASTRREPE